MDEQDWDTVLVLASRIAKDEQRQELRQFDQVQSLN